MRNREHEKISFSWQNHPPVIPNQTKNRSTNVKSKQIKKGYVCPYMWLAKWKLKMYHNFAVNSYYCGSLSRSLLCVTSLDHIYAHIGYAPKKCHSKLTQSPHGHVASLRRNSFIQFISNELQPIYLIYNCFRSHYRAFTWRDMQTALYFQVAIFGSKLNF